MYVFTNPFAQAGYDKNSIFKRSFTGLNSGFFSSLTYYLPKANEASIHVGDKVKAFLSQEH